MQCDEPDNPNLDRFCDQRDTDVPYLTQLKIAGTLSAALGHHGRRHVAELSGCASSAPTIQNRPGTNWLLTPTTRYAANCPGACTPNALVMPQLTEASLTVPLRP